MEAQSHDLDVPLLVDEKQETGFARKVEEVESPDCEDNPRGCTSFFKTCFNGLNALSGVGILSTPFALASGGWLSLLLLFAIAITAFYSGLLIQRCMDSDPSIRTYPDIGERAFGRTGRLLISVFMYVELFLVATGFLILEGDNLYNLLPSVEFEIGGFLSSKQSLVVIVALIVLPTVWVDNLSILSYVSASGVLASGIILLSIFWTSAFDGVGFRQKGRLVNWSGIPTAVSLYGFCYCAHPVFPTIYNSMKKKHQFTSVLVVCFILCTLGYASMAVMGYLMFGDAVESQITLNLPVGKLSSKIAIYTTLVNPICKYAIMVTPIVNAAKRRFPWPHNKKPLRIFISTALVISTVIVAICVPFFGYLMSLVGAFLSVSASIILPCLCYLKISGAYRSFGFESVTIGAIILLGVLVAVLGTYTALEEIVMHW
ncbi:amino acid transporter AVT1I isoform X2 [Punica granatum]|uniref:Amino acid transporter AVT1I isoform X2 n=2 Tax=Punica granatum TaxID=22663 RepID=A0A218WMW6_PUNGR|nr:amino acid transporter AVT1I isoform X2 [Punica granatum]OWM73953.1 hypothetical protein CDL15_Pgr022224 [Punica granatum]